MTITSVNRVSPHGVKALFEVLKLAATSSIAGHGGVGAMLLEETNTIDENWEDFDTLQGTGTLSEYLDSLSATDRKILTDVDITIEGGSKVAFNATGPTWESLATGASGSGVDISHVLFYVILPLATADPGLDLRIPLCLCDMVYTPAGIDLPLTFPTDGLFTLNTNGC